ncbi:anti-virulence regulator CigR family protein [Tepidicaulis sp. LMO-SS28]|uniref:anti-virulence regulator CigR family protein n=1 Tax=Tepidicaulis sp. LMO-SS28 TaxID=3447455 RepID=UPI003EE3E78E
MKTLLRAFAFAAALGMGAAGAYADPPAHAGKGGKKDGGDPSSIDIGIHADIRFGSDEQRIIRDYFGSHHVERQSLPPGIAKNLARGKPLPPGIAKRYLPGDLRGRLPYYEGYERLIVGDDVLLVAAATGIIVDILEDAF